MQKTLFAILTDASARQNEEVIANLSQEFSVGFPWYNSEE